MVRTLDSEEAPGVIVPYQFVGRPTKAQGKGEDGLNLDIREEILNDRDIPIEALDELIHHEKIAIYWFGREDIEARKVGDPSIIPNTNLLSKPNLPSQAQCEDPFTLCQDSSSRRTRSYQHQRL